MEKPSTKPKNPNFSSGPCSKRPGWTIDVLKSSPIGRSHRPVSYTHLTLPTILLV